ncbi:hypothetical protein AHF37_09258, partial [Paragonimus kellicotti]
MICFHCLILFYKVPQAPPADVTCASQQHSITVSWSPPHPDTINGILTEYHVSYFAANVYGDETSSVNQVVKGQTTVTLAGLLAYTNYTIQVSASNRKGRGPASVRLICLTKEAPPAAPEYVKAKPVNVTCLVVSWSHPRKPQGLTRQYCLEAIPLTKTSRDGTIDFLSTVPFAERSKGPCVRPDFSSPSNHYTYCGLVEQRPYNISVRAVNQFEGHKAWTGPVRPMDNPSMGIISIGGKIVAQNKMRVTMDCLVIGGYQPRWTYPQEDLECCYNVTQLNSGAHYHYKVVATNPAGSVSVQGQFWTLTVFGREPVLRQTHLVGQAGLFQQPTVIVPITAFFAIVLVVLIAIPFFCRHRRMEESLRPSKAGTTQCRNELRPGMVDPCTDDATAEQQRQRLLLPPHCYHPYQVDRGSRNAGLPPIPGQSDSQASTVMVDRRMNHAGRSGRFAGWFAGTRARLYDRGRGAGRDSMADRQVPTQSRLPAPDDDQLSTNSMDSEVVFPELTGTTGGTITSSTGLTGATAKPLVSVGGVSGGDTSLVMAATGARAGPRTRELSYGHQQRAAMDARLGVQHAWQTAFRPNPRDVQDSLIGLPGHHYHYPNMDSTTMGRPRLLRVGSASRLPTSQGFFHPRLLTPSAAALIDPMLTPYDNSTLGGGDLDDEDFARATLVGPMPRRVNSFESLH